MKKVTAREFQHSFSKLTKNLKPGETIHITYRGKPYELFVKPSRRVVKVPDFMTNLNTVSYPVELGNQILKEFNDSLS